MTTESREPRGRDASKGTEGASAAGVVEPVTAGSPRFRMAAWKRLRTEAGALDAPLEEAGVVGDPAAEAVLEAVDLGEFTDRGDAAEGGDMAATTLPSVDVARAHLRGVLEALVFASDRPMSLGDLARATKGDKALVKELLTELCAEYRGRGFRLDEVAGGYAFRTSPAFAPFVRDLAAKRPVRMSRAQIETLAIVAYRQPITRPEVDDVRGVDSGPVLKTLLERELVRILGKKDEPGRPMLYGTTSQFLEFFGLRAISELPTLREFTELSDESRRTFERELGEDAPVASAEGLAGSEGSFRYVETVADAAVAAASAALEDDGHVAAGAPVSAEVAAATVQPVPPPESVDEVLPEPAEEVGSKGDEAERDEDDVDDEADDDDDDDEDDDDEDDDDEDDDEA